MAYTFTQKTAPQEPQQLDDFAGMPDDGNHSAMPYASGVQTSDNTGTPVTSPVALSTATTTLTVPLNAGSVIFYAAAATNVSEVSNMASYYTIPAGGSLTVDCARMGKIYVAAVTGTPALSFLFRII